MTTLALNIGTYLGWAVRLAPSSIILFDTETSSSTLVLRAHEALGFTRAGLLASVGFKHGRWVGSVLMQRPLGAGGTILPEDSR